MLIWNFVFWEISILHHCNFRWTILALFAKLTIAKNKLKKILLYFPLFSMPHRNGTGTVLMNMLLGIVCVMYDFVVCTRLWHRRFKKRSDKCTCDRPHVFAVYVNKLIWIPLSLHSARWNHSFYNSIKIEAQFGYEISIFMDIKKILFVRA